MHALVALLTQILVGQVDRTSSRLSHRVWWRVPIYLFVFGSAAWVAVSSAFLWTSKAHPGIKGVLDFVRHGGPLWLLGVPLVAFMIVLVGTIPAAGRYGLVLVLQTATFVLTLLGLAAFQEYGQTELNIEAVSSFLVTLPATLLTIVTALADNPPVDSPLAHFTFSYFGRLGHLRALNATARRLGWEVEMPRPISFALAASGYFGSGRSVRVLSGATYVSRGSSDPPGYWYNVTITSPRPFPGFGISRTKIPPEFAPYAITGKVSGTFNFYVIPHNGQRVPASWTQRFTQQVASGKGYLRTRYNRVEFALGGLHYTDFNPFRLSAKSGHIEPLVEWLIGIASMLEEVAPKVDDVASLHETSDHERDHTRLP